MIRTSNIYHIIFPAAILGMISVLPASLSAKGQWSVSSSVQFSRGQYTFEDYTNTYYLYGGIRYLAPKWSLSAGIPLIAQNSDLVSNSGGTFLPSRHHGEENTGGTQHGAGMMGGGSFSNMEMGLGDLYLRGAYLIFSEDRAIPYVGGKASLKIPTAATAHNFGSGKLDYGLGFTFRKTFRDYLAVLDLGYWSIGDPAGIEYKDTHVLGAGAGRFFNQGQYGLMLYFQTYSQIISGLEGYRQISLGINYRANANLLVTVTGGAGLSETSPGFSLSSGFEWSL